MDQCREQHFKKRKGKMKNIHTRVPFMEHVSLIPFEETHAPRTWLHWISKSAADIKYSRPLESTSEDFIFLFSCPVVDELFSACAFPFLML